LTNSKSLRRIVKESTNQDIARCLGCSDCDLSLPEQDIPLGSLIQLALMDDEEALHSRTLWSDSVLEAARGACQRGLDLFTIMFTLREEAKRRGVIRE
jgi:heterodisulfide reductase subunit C